MEHNGPCIFSYRLLIY